VDRHAGSDGVVASLARDRGLAAGRRMKEIENLEIVSCWLGDRNVSVCPAVGRR
jgi:hypothetical protein